MTRHNATLHVGDYGPRCLVCQSRDAARSAMPEARELERILRDLYPHAGDLELARRLRVELRREGY